MTFEDNLLAAAALELDDAIIIHDLSGSIRVWNKGAEKLFGYTRQHPIALRMETLIAPGRWRECEKYLASILDGTQSGSLETIGSTLDGRQLVLLLKASRYECGDGQAPLIIGVMRDISAQKAAESELIAVIESTPDPFIIVGQRGEIQRVNRQAEALFGYSRAEMTGKSFEMLIPQRYRANHMVHTRNYHAKPTMRQMGSGLELRCLTASGEEIPVEIGLSPIASQNETIIMARIRDIREQLKEQDLIHEARRRADEANRTKSRFLAAASHDLRQPLQSISMNLGVLATDIDETRKEHVIAQTRMALDTTNKLLNSLLNITKLESGKVQPEIETFHLGDVLERVFNTEHQQAREKRHRFKLHTTSLAVCSDPALLEQLLTNLVANAVRYTSPHGHIVLGCRRRARHIRIDVFDNGPGIAANALDVIFDEYRQLDQVPHYQGAGLGLGLSIVKLLTELLHLKLEVRSVPGKGSCFSVFVPIAESIPEERRPGLLQKPPRQLTSGTVLLVDDDEAVLDSTSLFLGISGFRTQMARNSEEAFALLDPLPDLIITDYGLAQTETGIDLLRRIRRHVQREIPAIVITGDTSLQRPDDIPDTVKIVCKPIDAQALLQLVQQRIAIPGDRKS